MDFLGFFKEKKKPQRVNRLGQRMDRLTKDGELPYGWLDMNREFLDRVNNRYCYFLQVCLNSEQKSPREKCTALMYLIVFLEAVEKHCEEKGECFEHWFHESIVSRDYIANKKRELEELEASIYKRATEI